MSYQRASLRMRSVSPDTIPQDTPDAVWNTGENVMWDSAGETARVPGDTPTLPNAALNARTCVFVTSGGGKFWLYANETGVWIHDGAVELDVTPAVWAPQAEGNWTSCVLGGIGYINASTADPVYWDGNPVNVCLPLPDWPVNGRCNALRAHKNYLWAIGMVSEDASICRWSDAAEPGALPDSWTPAPDNSAGFQPLMPNAAACIDAQTLRDELWIYKTEGIFAARFVGGNQVFSFRKAFAEHGIAGVNAVTRGLDDVHLFVGSDGDVYLCDGVQVKSILDGRAQRTFYRDFSDNTGRLFSVATLQRSKIGLVIYPQSGETVGNRVLMFNYITGDIGFREVDPTYCMASGAQLRDGAGPNVWDTDSQPWDDDRTAWPQTNTDATIDDLMIGGSYGFAIISDPASNDFLSGPVVLALEKTGISFGDAEQRKLINRVWPKISGVAGDVVTFRLGGQEITGGPIALAPPVDFVIGQTTSLDTFVQGRFLSIQISSTGGSPYRMGSIDVEFRGLGLW
jgi:hypothetical protein